MNFSMKMEEPRKMLPPSRPGNNTKNAGEGEKRKGTWAAPKNRAVGLVDASTKKKA